MSFLDEIETKLKMTKTEYKPIDYEFSDGEGIEEGDVLGAN
jgi:hypothetical protein